MDEAGEEKRQFIKIHPNLSKFIKIWTNLERKSVNLSKTSWPDSLDGPQYIAEEDCQTEMIHKSTF